jgi:hypothetical protein
MSSLYPGEESSTLKKHDYGLILQIAAKGAKSVLEFGPGISTYAFIEAGVERIVSLEYIAEWRFECEQKFKDYPQVRIGSFQNLPVATGDLGEDETFDLAFVDSPKGNWFHVQNRPGVREALKGQEDCSRLNTCVLALKHAPVVYLHDAYRAYERATLGRLSGMGHKIDYVGGPKCGLARIIRNGTIEAGVSLQGVIQLGGAPAGAEPRQ